MTKRYNLQYPDFSEISERDRLLIEGFNKTDLPVPFCHIQNFFEKQVELRPDKIAVISGDHKLTYRELDVRSNRLAKHLLALQLSPGDIVGIFLERSVDMVVSVLAVLKAGGCYLPLDPSYPDERLKYMIKNSGSKILICQSPDDFRIKSIGNTLLVAVGNENNVTIEQDSLKPEIKIRPQSFAYILYTSGSTGKPKGVRIHHQAVVNFIRSMMRTPGISENDILLAVTTLSFDISVLELFLPISVGATVIVADSLETNNGGAIINLIEKYNITFLQATPSLWNFLLASGWQGSKRIKGICGGESLSSNLVRQLLPKIGELWNFYGPTETTVWSTGIKITDPESPVLIGKPIDNTKVYILNHDLKMKAIGHSGEICIGGLGVAKGYFKNSEITKQKFISFGEENVVYRTGDLGRFHDDGNIEFLGRIDNQIKLKGYRIEPGEIESALSRLNGVTEVVVKLHRFDENDDRLVAFLNTSDEFQLSDREIIDSISMTLPQYMVPRLFQKSDHFPRTPNGKIDKKALNFENKFFFHDENEMQIALTPTEEAIHRIWCKALKIKNISRIDNFFDIGGTSLIALSVFSDMLSSFKVDLGLNVFFNSPRIMDLAEEIDIARQKSVGDLTVLRVDTDSKIVEGEL